MTENQIIKALECCIKETSDCGNCPLYVPADADCINISKSGALDIINRQQADNERLKKLLEEADVNYNKCAKRFYKEAIKECLGKIEQMDVSESDEYIMVKKYKFDNLVKEMVGK